MKTVFTTLCALFISTLAFSQSYYGDAPDSKISNLLKKKTTTHTVESWQLESTRGSNKTKLVLEAVKYSSLKGGEELKGIKVILNPDNSGSEEKIAQSAKEFMSYIDKSEYAEITVVLNAMLNNYRKKQENNDHGYMSYITQGGIKIGFTETEQKELASLSVLYENAEIACEFSDTEEFLEEFKGFIDNASKELYLPENAEKLKKAKKSNQEAKDVIIDDI